MSKPPSEKNKDSLDTMEKDFEEDEDNIVLKVESLDQEVTEEEINELHLMSQKIMGMGNMMSKFTSVMGGLKDMLGSLTDRIAMIEEEVKQYSFNKEPIHLEIDEEDDELEKKKELP